ncbi:MAG: hypothetical protein ABGZ17_31920 [Planctomycetaceae bacterium]
MNSAQSDRVAWRCPVCSRRFLIPSAATLPQECPQCRDGVRDAPTVVESSATDTAVHGWAADSADAIEARMPGGVSAEVEAEITRRERREILRHLENVSRTMTFFRRLAWSLAVCMVVNAVVMGVVIHQSMQQVGTLAGVLRGAVSDGGPSVAPAGAENQPDLNQLQKSLQSLMHELQQR